MNTLEHCNIIETNLPEYIVKLEQVDNESHTAEGDVMELQHWKVDIRDNNI